ncbi:uncharacterized protein K444DRAFT_564413 [Hyaloscypha bicolor E]|uniref:Uncharacterized protein n=1 Tax=Hyaloscypha bicolor E TaxID=1095630 RepID=A0A2J6T4V5_9HELO|nr:uncharacterized protein K444DRAFT_564413 [Hyaloscypha bicolor E]PMD58054.1 hypothetical protein K444DRAFT_564413 [Hyaloscypha bicolor E]
MYSPNTVQLPGRSEQTSINDYLLHEELVHGPVHVISGTSGVLEGYLSPGSAYWMFEDFEFEVRTVFLDKQLNNGDSGSWVIRDNRLCGYILSRAVEQPWGYMLPIEPVLRDILKTLDGRASFEIPSEATVQQLRQRITLFIGGYSSKEA